MKKNVVRGVALLVLFLAGAACSPSSKTAPTEETPVLSNGDTVHFTLLQTTDVHHHVVGTGPSASYGTATDTTQGGYSRLAYKINAIRSQNDLTETPTVVVDCGDYFMGTVYDLSLGASPAALMFFQSVKYDAITIGNHELDYGPEPLAGFYNLAILGSTKFTVPVVASNMETDGVADTDDDGLEALKESGAIVESKILTLSNGLKVGILGLLGANAENDAPLAAPLTFNHDYGVIQAKVFALKSAGAQVIIALSHSGITDPNGTPGGDDIDLADNVMGIDIIASGHDHEMTDSVVTKSYNDDPNVWTTRIICAGKYGQNLAQLNVTFTVGSGVDTAVLTNNAIDKNVPQADTIRLYMVGALDEAINEALVEGGLPEVNTVIAGTNSNNVTQPETPGESGLGNLVSDSLRYLVQGAAPAVGIVSNGVIRNGYVLGQQISFADIYSTLPLGMTLDPANQNIPGYPLVVVYMNKTSILNLCKLAAYTIAASDDVFMTWLLANNATMYAVLSNLKADYYLNFSGVRYTYGAGYSVAEADVALYAATDFSCQSAPTIPLGVLPGYIPCVLDLYTALMFLDADMQALLTVAGLPIAPKVDAAGTTALSMANVLATRADRSASTAGVQEVKEWMALLQFVTNPTASAGLNNLIPDSKYGAAVIADGQNGSRVNAP